jgi:hypothetical protein
MRLPTVGSSTSLYSPRTNLTTKADLPTGLDPTMHCNVKYVRYNHTNLYTSGAAGANVFLSLCFVSEFSTPVLELFSTVELLNTVELLSDVVELFSDMAELFSDMLELLSDVVELFSDVVDSFSKT